MDRGGTGLGARERHTLVVDRGRSPERTAGVVLGDQSAHTELDEVEGEEPDLHKVSREHE